MDTPSFGKRTPAIPARCDDTMLPSVLYAGAGRSDLPILPKSWAEHEHLWHSGSAYV